MIQLPPSDLGYSIIRSYPAAETLAQRFALVDALFADLHASSERVWLAVLCAPGSNEVVVCLGSDSPTSTESGWAGPEVEPITDSSQLVELCQQTPDGLIIRPFIRAEPDFAPADDASPDTMAQLRLLEQSRRPTEVHLVVAARRASSAEGDEELAHLLRSTSSSVANQSRSAGIDEWTEHHRALAGSGELSRGSIGGLWRVEVEVAATRPGAVGRAVAALNEGLRLTGPFGLSADVGSRPTLVTGRFLSSLGVPPLGEIPGFRSVPIWFFDQTQERSRDVASTRIGTALTPTGDQGGAFVLSEQNLVRHTLVTGATGSGKTETVKRLVDGIGEGLGRPWMIIEPAKSEYRHLRFGADGNDAPLVIRPGDPDAPPLRFNPFQPEPGFPLRTHVDLVLALFLAAFEPVDPLPQILAASIQHAYRAGGWLVPVGTLEGASGDTPEDYPGLADLQRSADAVIDGIGYAGETLGNVRGFVNVRLASLRLGTAGGMLEQGYPVDFGALMAERVVIELDDIGNDQEKSFLMGVILVRLYEHLRVQIERVAREGRSSREFSHATIVEEAHRLLRAALPGEKPNFAVESFSNMLAELRSYGEGLVIVEQVPSKIVPDAVKNTGTKILHRLPAFDDREFAGLAANVEQDQLVALGSLPPGQAVCFTDEMDRPCRVSIARTSGAGTADAARPSLDRVMVAGSAVCPARAEPCSLGDLVVAAHDVDRAPAVGLWIEVAYYYAAQGWRPYRPTAAVIEQYAGLAGCGRCELVRAAIATRRSAIRRVIDPATAAALLTSTLSVACSTSAPERLEPADLFGEGPVLDDLVVRNLVAWGAGPVVRAAELARSLRTSGVASSVEQLMEHLVGKGISELDPAVDSVFA